MPGEESEELFTTDMFSGKRYPAGGKKQKKTSSEFDDWSPESSKPPKPAKPAVGGRQTTEAAIWSEKADERDEEKEKRRREALGLPPEDEVFPED